IIVSSLVQSSCLPRTRSVGASVLLGLSFDDPENIALFHDGELFAIDLDFGARPFAEQHAVALFHVELSELAALVADPGSDGDNLSLHGLFLDGIGNDNAAGGLFFLLNAPDHDAILQRMELHGVYLKL